MAKDKYKEQFSQAVSKAFQVTYADKWQKDTKLSVYLKEVLNVLEELQKPKDPKKGRFTFPVFRYSKALGDKPQDIATKVAAEATLILSKLDNPLVKCEAAAGFLNGIVDSNTLINETLSEILEAGSGAGSSNQGQGRTMLVEYSSPNIAKPFGIAHLRTTIIGNSLRRIFKKIGYKPIGINYLGDWGTQFGKMIVAFRLWGDENTLKDNVIENLHTLYVRFHEEAKEDSNLDDQARLAFKALEEGKAEETALWKQFSDLSIAEFKRVYELAGIEFDLWLSESMMNSEMTTVIDRLEKDGLTSVSQGALVVDLHDPQLPPCLLKKADGATLYATRDIAGMVYRWREYDFHESLYVVATSQSDHFKQVYKVVEMMEDAENIPPEKRMTGKVKHVDFGWVKFGDKAMSTRKGNVIYLEDVIDRATKLVQEIIAEKNPDLEKIEQTSIEVGVGAVIFSQFSVRRLKDVNFNWEAVLSFDGETGPYLQYTHARLSSLIRKFGDNPSADFDSSLLTADEELRLVEHLADFSEAVASAARNYDPFFIAAYLLKLTAAFNTFYQRKDSSGKIEKIISDDSGLTMARIALVGATQIVLKEGLRLLGIKAPEAM